MSGFVCCLLVSAGWYFLAYLPGQREIAAYKVQLQQEEQQREQEEQKAHDDEIKRQQGPRRAKGRPDRGHQSRRRDGNGG